VADEGVIGARKRDHLEICLDGDRAASGRGNGLDRYALVHDALPEVDFDAIDLSTEFLGHALSAPLIISSMTGGTDRATSVNRTLARAAQHAGIAMGVGSQRAALEDDVVAQTYRIRDAAPDVLLFGNLGAVQLNRGYGLDECLAAVEMIEADGLFLHLNSLQEACQEEGDRDFSGLRDRIASLCRHAPFPVLLKTVGNGISPRTARKLVGLPLAGLEVSGAGGTSWSKIEALRGGDDGTLAPFASWGESTAESIGAVRSVLPTIPLIASGGIGDGVDVARALALGADVAGIARPMLQAAHRGEDTPARTIERIAHQLRISCFYCGRASVRALDADDLRGPYDGPRGTPGRTSGNSPDPSA